MPTGGEHIAYGLGAVADEDPCVAFRREVNEAARKHGHTSLFQPDAHQVEDAAVKVFRVWLERHNTELHQHIARGVAAELERIRREIHDEGALATYTAMDVEMRLDSAASVILAALKAGE